MTGRKEKESKFTFADAFMRIFPFILPALLILAAIAGPVSAGEVRTGQNIYFTITDALKYTEDGGTIIVSAGEYPENIIIDRPVQLIGVDSGDGKPEIITQNGESGVIINADGVAIEGFTITGNSDCAILVNSDNNIISENEILNTPVGITLYSSAGTSISGNTIKGHRIGLFIDDSVDCDVYLNNFENIINAKSLSKAVRWSTASLIYMYSGNNFTSSLGNYWNDYYGTDENKNGIGDIPYNPYETDAGALSTQNQLFINNINLQNLASAGSSYWQNLFYTANYVNDDFPLIEHNSMYNPVAPAGTETEILEPYVPSDIFPANMTGRDLRPPETPPDAEWWNHQSPFEIVFIMLLISGVSAGLIGLAGGFGILYPVRRTRRIELIFFELGYFALATALLYTIISYTSKLIYNSVDFGYIQIIFILMTAYLIASSGILGFGFLRSKVPLLLKRIHPVFAAVTTLSFFISIYTAPLDLGPITSVAYPAALILSVLFPLVFSRLFWDTEQMWIKNSNDRYYTKKSSSEQDLTVVFHDEGEIMRTGLGSSYFPESLNERYQDVEFIGKGGIARVFKATRRSDGKIVAVKVPINFDEITGHLFMKEMRIWEDLNHPNIVKLYSVNILPVPFVEMEYVSKAVSDLNMPLSQRDAFEILSDVAHGLSYAHKRHIIHRDIKPQNILITEDNTAKITDWGLGKIMGDGNDTTTIGFSLNYAAPEQIAPKKFGKPDERTDIYQMGILFYEMLFGVKPFTGLGVADMSDEILNKTPVLPSKNREKDSVFDEIILKMLSKKPDDRYFSVDELIKDLNMLSKKIDK
ncbi:MAG: protein kinase [Methanomicrobiaceae archaeon]|nr:protein kinase [Methanomicrobiaceae archaeon]